MEAMLTLALLFLPAIVFFVRSPHKPGNAGVLGALLGMWMTLTVLGHLGDWLVPNTGGYWFAGIGWCIMLIYAWKTSGAEQAEWNKHYAKKKSSRTQ